MTKLQIALLVLNAVVMHVLKYWYLYGTFVLILVAPFPAVLAVGLGWLGYVWYRVAKAKKEEHA